MSSLVIESCTFLNSQTQDSYYTAYANKQLGDLNGGFISIGPNSTVSVSQSKFTGARTATGGCIAIQGSSHLRVSYSSFVSCAANLGGAIFASNFKSLIVVNSTFQRNIAYSGYSQNIYCSGVKVNVTLNQNYFFSYHNSIFINQASLLSLLGNTFLPESNRLSLIPLQEYAGGLHILNTASIISSSDASGQLQNTFQGLTGARGGAISIECDLNFKTLNPNTAYYLSSLLIKDCTATKDGGGLYLKNPGKVTLKDSLISFNQALNGNGGGIMFFCNQTWQGNIFC